MCFLCGTETLKPSAARPPVFAPSANGKTFCECFVCAHVAVRVRGRTAACGCGRDAVRERQAQHQGSCSAGHPADCCHPTPLCAAPAAAALGPNNMGACEEFAVIPQAAADCNVFAPAPTGTAPDAAKYNDCIQLAGKPTPSSTWTYHQIFCKGKPNPNPLIPRCIPTTLCPPGTKINGVRRRQAMSNIVHAVCNLGSGAWNSIGMSGKQEGSAVATAPVCPNLPAWAARLAYLQRADVNAPNPWN